jgi:hypothetical protein
MDTSDGDNEDPISLHKYLYCEGNPVDGIDPTGQDDLTLPSMSIAMTISAALDAAVMTSITVALFEIPFRNWTIYEGVNGYAPNPAHAYIAAVSRTTDWRYDISVSPKTAVLAKNNPTKMYRAKLTVRQFPRGQGLAGFYLPIGKLSDGTFSLWNKFVIKTPSPIDGWSLNVPYNYYFLNCYTYSSMYLGISAMGLTLLPF